MPLFYSAILVPIHLDLHPFFHVFLIFSSDARLKDEIAL